MYIKPLFIVTIKIDIPDESDFELVVLFSASDRTKDTDAITLGAFDGELVGD